MFRRLKSSWNSIDIDYDNLIKFDYSSVPEWMVEAVGELAKKTWPRDDYKELLQLTIICLGGHITGFHFMFLNWIVPEFDQVGNGEVLFW